jgi:hypothetical protein
MKALMERLGTVSGNADGIRRLVSRFPRSPLLSSRGHFL